MSREHAPGRVRKIVSKRELLQMIPLSYVSVWQMMRRGDFPLSVRLDDSKNKNGKVGWYLDEVQAWQESRSRTELKPLTEAEAERIAEPA